MDRGAGVGSGHAAKNKTAPLSTTVMVHTTQTRLQAKKKNGGTMKAARTAAGDASGGPFEIPGNQGTMAHT